MKPFPTGSEGSRWAPTIPDEEIIRAISAKDAVPPAYTTPCPTRQKKGGRRAGRATASERSPSNQGSTKKKTLRSGKREIPRHRRRPRSTPRLSSGRNPYRRKHAGPEVREGPHRVQDTARPESLRLLRHLSHDEEVSGRHVRERPQRGQARP